MLILMRWWRATHGKTVCHQFLDNALRSIGSSHSTWMLARVAATCAWFFALAWTETSLSPCGDTAVILSISYRLQTEQKQFFYYSVWLFQIPMVRWLVQSKPYHRLKIQAWSCEHASDEGNEGVQRFAYWDQQALIRSIYLCQYSSTTPQTRNSINFSWYLLYLYYAWWYKVSYLNDSQLCRANPSIK